MATFNNLTGTVVNAGVYNLIKDTLLDIELKC